MEIDWKEVAAIIKRRVETSRKYAGFWEWDEQALEEYDVIKEFTKSLDSAGVMTVSHLKPCRPDPPDCTAKAADGALIAYEASELVSELAIRRTKKGEHGLWVQWDDKRVVSTINNILRKKDARLSIEAHTRGSSW
jgi:hypothetical protein